MLRIVPSSASALSRMVLVVVAVLVALLKVFDRLHRAAQRDLGAGGNQPGNRVGLALQAQHAPNVAHRRFGGHRVEGHDLRHFVPAILFSDIDHHIFTPVIGEVGVNIGHALAFGVQEALEQQAILERVHAGDAQHVADQAARRRAARRTADAALARLVIEVPDDQEVGDKALLADDVELVIQPVFDLVGHLAIALFHALKAELIEIVVRGFIANRDGEVGQQRLPKLHVDLAHFGDAHGVLERFGHVAKERGHLVGALQIILLAVELHALGVFDAFARLHAEQNILRLGVFGVHIMQVVGGNQRQPRLFMQIIEHLIDAALLRFFGLVVLNLQKEMVGAEDLTIPVDDAGARR